MKPWLLLLCRGTRGWEIGARHGETMCDSSFVRIVASPQILIRSLSSLSLHWFAPSFIFNLIVPPMQNYDERQEGERQKPCEFQYACSDWGHFATVRKCIRFQTTYKCGPNCNWYRFCCSHCLKKKQICGTHNGENLISAFFFYLRCECSQWCKVVPRPNNTTYISRVSVLGRNLQPHLFFSCQLLFHRTKQRMKVTPGVQWPTTGGHY